MPNPPSLPDPKSRYQNGHGARTNGHGTPPSRLAPLVPEQNRGLLTFLAPFLGAFAAVFVLGLVGVIGFFAYNAYTSPSTASSSSTTASTTSSSSSSATQKKDKNLLMDTPSWQQGKDVAKTLDGTDKPDIGWWARHFDLPKEDDVMAYLNKQGLKVSRIEPTHYQDSKDSTVITYNVYAEVPQQLMHLQQTSWRPSEPDMTRFSQVLVINNGLPAGTMWNTANPTVAAEAGTKLNFAWKVDYDKIYGLVDTDKLPLSEGVFTQEEVGQYQDESNNTITQLRGQIQQIDAQVQNDTQAKLAQIPPDPPKPELVSSHWNHGDGSGEPTKSAERIGGGTVAGAAGGAAFGAAAGDAGMGAGIGAGVGLLGGIIYDTVSKNNDRHRYERAAAAENEERLDNWHEQLRDLKKQRAQIQQDSITEKNSLLNDLVNRIAANKGHLDGSSVAVSSTENAQPVSDAPPVQTGAQPTADQPSGPLLASNTTPSPGDATAIGATIVDSPGGNGTAMGNVEVTYSNGQTMKVTQDARSKYARSAGNGLVGWAYEVGQNEKYGREKDLLAVRMRDGTIKNFAANAIYIQNWGFSDKGTAVTIRSMNHHGPDYYIKYDIATGKTLTELDHPVDDDKLPVWAKPVSQYVTQ